MYVPREPLRQETAELLRGLAAGNTCAVHVRGGDVERAFFRVFSGGDAPHERGKERRAFHRFYK